jgi:heat shock protein HslJ
MIEDRLAQHFTTVPPDTDAEQRILRALLSENQARRDWQRVLAVCGAVAVAVAVVVLAAVLAVHRRSSSPVQPAVGSTFFGVTWLDRAADVTLVFTPHTIHESDGCVGSTNALAIDDRLHVGRRLPPGYLCSGPPRYFPGTPGYAAWRRQKHAESLINQILGSTPHWSISGTTLTLTDERGRTVRLTDKGTARLSLPGSSWTSIPVRLRGTGAGPRYPAMLTFGTDGTFHARDVCRSTYAGKYEVSAGQIRISDVATTTHACMDPHEASIVLPAFHQGGTVDYRIEHNLLRLTQHGVRREVDLRPAG